MAGVTAVNMVDLTDDEPTTVTPSRSSNSHRPASAQASPINRGRTTPSGTPATVRGQSIDLTEDNPTTLRRSIQQRYGTLPSRAPAEATMISDDHDLPPLDEVLRTYDSSPSTKVTQDDVFNIGSQSRNSSANRHVTFRESSITREASVDDFSVRNTSTQPRTDEAAEKTSRNGPSNQVDGGSSRSDETAQQTSLGGPSHQDNGGSSASPKDVQAQKKPAQESPFKKPQRKRGNTAPTTATPVKRGRPKSEPKTSCARCLRLNPKCTLSNKYCDVCIQDNWSAEAQARSGKALSNIFCAICQKLFFSPLSLKGHFNNCKHQSGNPNDLKWNSHPSVKRYLADQEEALDKAQSRLKKAPSNIDQPIDVFANANGNSRKRGAEVEQLTVAKALLSDIPVDTLFNPNQIASKNELGKSQLKRRKTVRWTDPSDIQTEDDATFHEDATSSPPAEEEEELSPRPTTGGKRISSATLAALDNKTVPEVQKETPELAYIYFFDLKAWIKKEDIEVFAKNFGPFHTLEEANTRAGEEIKYPLDHFEELANALEEPEPVAGWSYEYHVDGFGMQTHRMLARNIQGEAVVRREVPPSRNKTAIPSSAFLAPAFVFVVQRLLRFSPQGDDLFGDSEQASLPDCEHTTLAVCTVADLAFKRAAKEYISVRCRLMTSIEKDVIKMEMRKDLKVMEENNWNVMLNKTVHFEEVTEDGTPGRKGSCAVWVEKIQVKGPRN